MFPRLSAVVVLLVLLLVPRSASTQVGPGGNPPGSCELGPGCLNDLDPPAITITPGTGSTYHRATLLVTVAMSDDVGFGTNQPSISLSGKWEDLATWQGSVAGGSMQKALTLTPGVNRIHAEICDQVPQCAQSEVLYTYEPSYGVLVGPDGAVQTLTPAAAGSQVFTVTNTSAGTARYLLSLDCTGPVSGCALSAPEITLGAGASGTVTATFAVGAAGTPAVVSLTARDADNSGTTNRGWVEVVRGAATGTPAAPVVNVTDHNPGTSLARDLCVTARVGAGAGYECGDLRLFHGLPAVRTMNRVRAPVLLYTSQAAHPVALVAAGVSLPAGARSPDRVVATLRSGNTVWATQEWEGREWGGSIPRRILLRYAGAELTTGLYDYTLEVTNWYGSVPYSTTSAGQLIVVDRRRSAFGLGWWLAGVERLHPVPSDTSAWLWVGGDGSARVYRKVRAGVWGAAPLDRPDTLRLVGGEYVRELPHGVRVVFDAQGRHVRTSNRLGQVTHFDYSTHATYGERLDAIRVPAPGRFLQSHTFTYAPVNDGLGPRFRLGSVSSYAAESADPDRVVTLGYGHSDSRVTSITDPNQQVVQFSYENPAAPNRVTRRTDRRGFQTSFEYDAVGKLAGSSAQVGSGEPDVSLRFSAGESLGATRSVLAGTTPVVGLIGPPSSANHVYTTIDGPRSDVQDEVHFEIGRFGEPKLVRNPLGHQTFLRREDPRFPALVTTVIQPNFLEVSGAYDDRGNLVSASERDFFASSLSGECQEIPVLGQEPGAEVCDGSPQGPTSSTVTTRYEWDPTWDFVTKIVDPEQNLSPQADSTTFGYDPANGNRLWMRDPAGNLTEFKYDTISGMPREVWSPEGRVEEIGYDEDGTNLGNVAWTKSPAGIVNRVATDLLGQVRFARTLISEADTMMTETIYDVMGRVREVRSLGPRLEYQRDYFDDNHDETAVAEAQALLVQHLYDEEGNVLSTTRSGTENGGPMPTGIGALTTRWSYDGLGRVLSEASPNGAGLFDPSGGVAVETYEHDPAGNVVKRTTRRGHTIRSEYDAAGRLVRKIVPEIVHGAILDRPSGIASGETLPWRFPRFVANAEGRLELENTLTYSLTMEREITEYRYDVMGNLVFAQNPWARVARSWNLNGTLATDSLQIAPYSGPMQPGLHSYGIEYTYDLARRVRTMRHPANMAPRVNGQVKDTESYGYDVNGRLETLTNVLGGQYTFSYHPDGPVHEVVTPTGVRTVWGYDADGQIESRTETTPVPMMIDGHQGTLLHHDVFAYDARGKVTGIETLTGRVRNAYSGLGALVWHLTEEGQFDDPNPLPGSVTKFSEERFALDALGNQYDVWSNGTSESQEAPHATDQRYTYQSTTGRLTDRTSNPSGNWPATSFSRTSYDDAGNTDREESLPHSNKVRKITRFFYDAEDRLRVLDRRACEFVNGQCNRFNVQEADYSTFEEYRYDPLGRRIFARTRQDWNCHSGNNHCDNTVRRFVWNGDHLLYETRYPGATGASWQAMERDTGLVVFSGQPPMYGRVAYTNGPEIDRPLDFIRMDFSYALPEPEVVYPHRNWRGQIDRLSFHDGAFRRCNESQAEAPGTCINAQPPASSLSMLYGRTQSTSATWLGGQLDNMRDPSGQLYMRNRYYDPGSGKFTQEDPIGLAGGVNLYGYANGDPVTYRDPYGLEAEEVDPDQRGLGVLRRIVRTVQAWRAARVMQQVKRSVRIVERDGDVVEVAARVDRGDISIVTQMSKQGDDLILQGTHIDGPGRASVGREQLRWIAEELGKQQGAKRVIVQGAERSTGRTKGRVPRPHVYEVPES